MQNMFFRQAGSLLISRIYMDYSIKMFVIILIEKIVLNVEH